MPTRSCQISLLQHDHDFRRISNLLKFSSPYTKNTCFLFRCLIGRREQISRGALYSMYLYREIPRWELAPYSSHAGHMAGQSFGA